MEAGLGWARWVGWIWIGRERAVRACIAKRDGRRGLLLLSRRCNRVRTIECTVQGNVG
jgi:hypothetical protein